MKAAGATAIKGLHAHELGTLLTGKLTVRPCSIPTTGLVSCNILAPSRLKLDSASGAQRRSSARRTSQPRGAFGVRASVLGPITGAESKQRRRGASDDTWTLRGAQRDETVSKVRPRLADAAVSRSRQRRPCAGQGKRRASVALGRSIGDAAIAAAPADDRIRKLALQCRVAMTPSGIGWRHSAVPGRRRLPRRPSESDSESRRARSPRTASAGRAGRAATRRRPVCRALVHPSPLDSPGPIRDALFKLAPAAAPVHVVALQDRWPA